MWCLCKCVLVSLLVCWYIIRLGFSVNQSVMCDMCINVAQGPMSWGGVGFVCKGEGCWVRGDVVRGCSARNLCRWLLDVKGNFVTRFGCQIWASGVRIYCSISLWIWCCLGGLGVVVFGVGVVFVNAHGAVRHCIVLLEGCPNLCVHLLSEFIRRNLPKGRETER